MPLYATEADLRDKLLSEVSYELILNLGEKEDVEYEGSLRVTFLINDVPGVTKEDIKKGLFLDFHGK